MAKSTTCLTVITSNKQRGLPSSHPGVALPLLKEILQTNQYTVPQIAKECCLSPQEINRLLRDHSATVQAKVFNKILCLYCRVCYDKQGHKLINDAVFNDEHS